jgi:hypothetical protein
MKTDSQHAQPKCTEELVKENEMLKAKLTQEFGMKHSEANISPELENEWLRNIYNFEKAFAENKRTSVYNYIGKPAFKRLSELAPGEISPALRRLHAVLQDNSIELSTLCEYDDEVIYKFITEELFSAEINEIRVEGMKTCFIYEEFHPNHEYDLRHHATEFLEALLGSKCRVSYISHWLDETVTFQEKEYLQSEFAMRIMMMHESAGPFEILSLKVNEIEYDLDSAEGKVKGALHYRSSKEKNDISFELGFMHIYDWWVVKSVLLPGFDNM